MSVACRKSLVLSGLLVLAVAGSARAQTSTAPATPAPNSLNSGASSTGTLSDKLERSDGVIRPRGDVDPGITTAAPVPHPGTTPVIPPPGSPGGNQSVQPK